MNSSVIFNDEKLVVQDDNENLLFTHYGIAALDKYQVQELYDAIGLWLNTLQQKENLPCFSINDAISLGRWSGKV